MTLTKSNISYQYWIHGVNVVGLVICVYALIVELHHDADPNYKASCDFSEGASCSKAFTSKWGKGFGIVGPLLGEDHPWNLKNPIFGISFYALLTVLTMFNSVIATKATLWLAILANVGSIYLAYILYFHVQSLCVVCVSLYVVNLILLILTYQRLSIVKKLSRKKRD